MGRISHRRYHYIMKGSVSQPIHLPCPRSHGEAAGQCRSVAPTWLDRWRWTGQWCTGQCWKSHQTEPPRWPERWGWSWSSPAQTLHTGTHYACKINTDSPQVYWTFSCMTLCEEKSTSVHVERGAHVPSHNSTSKAKSMEISITSNPPSLNAFSSHKIGVLIAKMWVWKCSCLSW